MCKPTPTSLLSSNRGETLVETLAGVLVCVLASVVLATGVVSAAHMNARAEQAEAEFRDDQKAAELQDVDPTDPVTANITIAPQDPALGEGATIEVQLHGGDGVVSYSYDASSSDAGGTEDPENPSDPEDTSGGSDDGEGGGA